MLCGLQIHLLLTEIADRLGVVKILQTGDGLRVLRVERLCSELCGVDFIQAGTDRGAQIEHVIERVIQFTQ